jgi:hypothetical protein
MTTDRNNPTDVKLLPGTAAESSLPVTTSAATTPSRQMSEMPREELEHLAEELGIDPTRFRLRQDLVAAVHGRRQMIAAMDRDAMLDVIRWGRRPVTRNASKEHLAQEIVRITSMRFAGLSQRGLVVLARLRGVEALDDEPVPALVKRLKKKEGLFARMNRKRRAMLGGIVAKIVGESGPSEYQYVPSDGAGGAAPAAHAGDTPGIKHEIEESGLLGGITSRLKKSADTYVNQKLDEIEARIDRKLDEIDRRLAEWRDKEIANRIRILKITLWASVIVAVCSLIYTYVDVHFINPPAPAGAPTTMTVAR